MLKMTGLEEDYCDVVISALIAASRSLMESPALSLLSKAKYGKGDTFELDALPEIIIKERLTQRYDQNSIFITEEIDEVTRKNWPKVSDPILQPLMFFCDPVDRSAQLIQFLQKISAENNMFQVGQLRQKQNWVKLWEEETFQSAEKPANITGATMAITCFMKGRIIFSVILNYITQVIYIATPLGIYHFILPDYADLKRSNAINLNYIIQHGKPLYFPLAEVVCRKEEDFWRFTTFLGKEGYRENFDESLIFIDNADRFLHHSKPGGPARVLYLSELQNQAKDLPPIGFILANGEKIGEWIHWLSFVKFAKNKENMDKSLKVFEVSISRPHTKNGVLMSVFPYYSIFCEEEGHNFFDIAFLRRLPSPNKFRGMLVVTQADNERIIYTMRKHQYREITDFI